MPAKANVIELEQDLAFQKREWRVNLLTWFALLVMMAACVLGLFGHGPLSSAEVSEPSSFFRVEYERFLRYGSASRLRIHARADATGSLRLSLGQTMVERFELRGITPGPDTAEAGPNGIEYRFAGAPGADVVIEIDVVPIARGSVHARLGSADSELAFRQFVYP